MRRSHAISIFALLLFGGVVLAAFRWLGAREAGTTFGFPLDDAWIHIRFAQNLAAHGEFAFNPGEPTAGATSPLWVVLVALGSFILRDFALTSLLLGVIGYLALGILVWAVVRRIFESDAAGVLAAVIVLVNVRVVWAAFSGMEVCLAALLAVAAVGAFAAEESGAAPRDGWKARLLPWATPVLFGLASLARPEAHLLFALAVFLKLARSCRYDTPVREFFKLIPYRMILLYLLVTLPWHLFALGASGSVLPNTFWANFRGLATRSYPPGYYTAYGRWLFVRDHLWIYWFVIPGLAAVLHWTIRQARRGSAGSLVAPYGLAFLQLAALWAITYPPASRAILPLVRHHARYMIPMTPFHALLAVAGILGIVELAVAIAKRRPHRRTACATGALAVLVALSAAPGLVRWGKIYGRNVYSINHQHVAMARWIRDNTPPDAVIATHDVGAIGALADRKVLDLFGLVSPDLLRPVKMVIPTLEAGSEGHYLGRIRDHNATYLVGYPGWLEFMYAAPDAFEEVHRATLTEPDICGGTEMVAWRIRPDELRTAVAPAVSR